MTTGKNKLTPEEEARQRLLQRARVLRKGISDEAMEILRDRAQMGLPVFRDCEVLPDGSKVPLDAHVMAMRAAMRDGEQGLVKWIEAMRGMVEKEGEQ